MLRQTKSLQPVSKLADHVADFIQEKWILKVKKHMQRCKSKKQVHLKGSQLSIIVLSRRSKKSCFNQTKFSKSHILHTNSSNEKQNRNNLTNMLSVSTYLGKRQILLHSIADPALANGVKHFRFQLETHISYSAPNSTISIDCPRGI